MEIGRVACVCGRGVVVTGRGCERWVRDARRVRGSGILQFTCSACFGVLCYRI